MSESAITTVNRLVPDSSMRASVFEEIAQKEAQGYSFGEATASLELLIARVLNGKKMPFGVKGYHVSMRKDEDVHVCEASVKVIVNGAMFFEVSDGNGPLSAIDGALRMALHASFPQLQKIKLMDYSVRLVGAYGGADAKTSVLVVTGDTERRWGTVGVSSNVVEASVLALADGLEYALMPNISKSA